jgi:hypothetical protein
VRFVTAVLVGLVEGKGSARCDWVWDFVDLGIGFVRWSLSERGRGLVRCG